MFMGLSQCRLRHSHSARLADRPVTSAASLRWSGRPLENSLDIASSSDTYLIVVDSNGALLASSAQLEGRAVSPPSGVFAYVRDHGEDMISWQPPSAERETDGTTCLNIGRRRRPLRSIL